MNNLKTIRLTVAKICHEIANHISIIKFLQDDLKSSSIYEVKELIDHIDLLSLVMNFFRSIYSVDSINSDILGTIKDIMNIKKIKLLDENLFYKCDNTNELKIICGILYILIKASKEGDTIVLSSLSNDSYLIFNENKSRTFPAGLISAINNREVNSDVLNVFVLYIKQIANEIGCKIIIDEDNKVKIYAYKSK